MSRVIKFLTATSVLSCSVFAAADQTWRTGFVNIADTNGLDSVSINDNGDSSGSSTQSGTFSRVNPTGTSTLKTLEVVVNPIIKATPTVDPFWLVVARTSDKNALHGAYQDVYNNSFPVQVYQIGPANIVEAWGEDSTSHPARKLTFTGLESLGITSSATSQIGYLGLVFDNSFSFGGVHLFRQMPSLSAPVGDEYFVKSSSGTTWTTLAGPGFALNAYGTSAVPEPSTVTVLLVSALALARRKKTQTQSG